MKKMTKKAVSLGLVATMALSMTACNSATGNNSTTTAPETTSTEATSADSTTEVSSSEETTTQQAEIVKPEKIKVMWDGTIFKEGDNYAEAFYKALEEKLGIQIEWVRPDHSGYADQIGIAFNDKSTLADVVVLPSNFYASYAAQGNLWNMTDAWNNSEIANSGRLNSYADSVINTWLTKGPDGEEGIYGMYPARGGGCVTYVNKALAEQAGYTEDTLPTTWAEYQEFLAALKNVTGAAPILAAGLVTGEAPYVNYLPEFYQDAYPDFYYDETAGTWVDGFTTDAMAAALDRLAWGVSEGYLDADIFSNPSTSKVRDKFYEGTSTSVFTYWAGTWAQTITDKLANKGWDEGVWVLKPIAEVGAYTERLSPMICITSACQNPEGVFKYFIDPILDGGEVQTLWQYGVEGTHYVVGDDGKFVFQLTESAARDGKSSKTAKNLFESQLKIADFDSAVYPDGDPGAGTSTTEAARNSFSIFNENSKFAPKMNATDESLENQSTIWNEKTRLIAAVAQGQMTGAEAIAEYQANCGALSQSVLDSFNH